MVKVNFYDHVTDDRFRFAVIISRSDGKWVYCRHKLRSTFELPGGTREEGESIDDTAKRELYEETGAIEYSIEPVCAYSVDDGEKETFGMLYYAEITAFEGELHSEIERIFLFEEAPSEQTYPHIQPMLIKEFKRRKGET